MSEPSIGNLTEANTSPLRKLFVNPSLVNETLMGVDIGNAGGMCVNLNGNLFVHEMPEEVTERWKILNAYGPDVIAAENVHAFAGQGSVSTGVLMKNRGQIEMAYAALGSKMEFINPLNWIRCYTMKRKKHFKRTKEEYLEQKEKGIVGETWKGHLQGLARDMVGGALVNERITQKVADAILIWNYQASILIGQPMKPMGLQFSFDL